MRTTEIWNLDTLLTDEELDLLAVAIAGAAAEYRSQNNTELVEKFVKLGTQLINDSTPYHPEEEFDND